MLPLFLFSMYIVSYMYTYVNGFFEFTCIFSILILLYLIERDDDMATSKAQLKASKKYISEKLDEIRFRVPKGEREKLKKHAEKMGESLNKFMYRAVNEAIDRDNLK